MQRSLVVLTGIEADGWEIASDYRPARSIGGDFFDVFPLLDPARPRTLGVVIADVSGKGIAAALLMAFVRPVVRSALDRSGDPVEALVRTNRILVEERQTGLFVTVLAGILDLDTGRFEFANAGHEPPLLVPAEAGEPRWIDGGGALIGAFRDPGLERCTVEIEPGGRLVLYTDGITDAANPAHGRFGETRLAITAGGGHARDDTAGATVQGVIDEVLRFQGEADPADDLALLVLRRLPAG
ncbi:MAG TPA: PP2C family protein-serine/threonine phosphatase [Candidatus Limnocylindrales bacterium]